MVITTTSWGEPGRADSPLLHAEMSAALGDRAQVAGVAVNHVTGVVSVVVRLPGDLPEPNRDGRLAWVNGTLTSLVEETFEADGLVLAPIHAVQRAAQ
jgi:hypothetical protein